MIAEEEFEEWVKETTYGQVDADWATVKRAWLHQQEKIDEWRRNWHLEMAHSSKCEEKIRELADEVNGLKEGINAALSYNLPWLAEKVLRELLKEQP